MSEALADLPEIKDQHRFNLDRWAELLDDQFLASLDYRIETDQYGQIVMMPPPGFQHSRFQAVIMEHLRDLIPGEQGQALPECPLSTTGGVKGIDIVWISNQRVQEGLKENVLTIAPEICVEVLSPSNTRNEIQEKKRLYFDAGAEEVWICGGDGKMTFFDVKTEIESSRICPQFPRELNASV